MAFDPNAAAAEGSGIFGLPTTRNEASLVYLPVPWEATTSYGGGTASGPAGIFEASHQVDLFDLEVERPYEAGLYMEEISAEIQHKSDRAKTLAMHVRTGKEDAAHLNRLSQELNQWVYAQSKKILGDGKILALLGGDHSTPLGALQAIAEKCGDFGVLHFDAHSDTRIAYEGFTYSHASIFYNVMNEIPAVKKLVQVGIRDLCEQEYQFCKDQSFRIKTFFDRDIKQRQLEGTSWSKISQDILKELPSQVWISFDIDGLDPRYCPNTGTPVPGGLDYSEVVYLMSQLARSGRKIIGFDLNEVAPDASGKSEWDCNVGARLLYKMSALTLASQGKAKFS